MTWMKDNYIIIYRLIHYTMAAVARIEILPQNILYMITLTAQGAKREGRHRYITVNGNRHLPENI